MTIRMLTAYEGMHEFQVVTLASEEETRLIGLGFATADIDGPDGSDELALVEHAAAHTSLRIIGRETDGSVAIAKTSGVGLKVDIGTPTFGWRDITAEVDTRGTGANDPTFAVYTGTNLRSLQFSATVMQECFIVFHMPHDYVPGSAIHFHAHWSNAAATPNTGNVIWAFEYSFAKGFNQAAFPAPTTITVTQASPATRYQHMVAETTAVTIAGLEVDGLILVRAYRDAAAGGDTCTDAVFLHTCDVHYQSTNMATKGKAPNFYA